MLQADYRTGKIKWSHKWETPGIEGGLLSTAKDNLSFAGDPSNNLVALNATTGEPLWHANLGSLPVERRHHLRTDGHQYVVVGAGDKLYAFVMN